MRKVRMFALLVPLCCTLLGEQAKWQRWSEGKAKKVIKEATKVAQLGFWQDFGRLMGGAVTGVKMTGVQITWVTDDVCWAVARISQVQERLTDEETIAVHDEMRAELKGYYAFYVSAFSMWFTHFGGWIGEEVVEAENPKRIFLQHKKDKSVFLRPVKVVRGTLEFTRARYMNQLPSADQDVFILFPRDEDFLEGQKEVEFEIIQEGGKFHLGLQARFSFLRCGKVIFIRAKFKPRKLSEDFGGL
ncbi:hypothetical protein MYX65_09250 [Acidobacteria bacterium AH-259-L09]|nr:hypothetical protein [Acidobacteria bacterium AH-259-L09]